MSKLELTKLPISSKLFLEGFFMTMFPTTPEESMLLLLNITCSRILCYNRVKIRSKNGKIDLFPNLYGITFMPSGAGKDAPANELKKMILPIIKDHETEEAEYFHEALTKIDEKSKAEGWTQAITRNYKMQYGPRKLHEEIGNATAEGLIAARAEYSRARFGSIHFAHSEFIDYISTNQKEGVKADFLAVLKDVYEHGDNKVKETKGDKDQVVVRGVPQTMMVHSSLSGLVEDKTANTQLKNFFDRGFARRSLICYPDRRKEYEDISIKEQEENDETEKVVSSDIRDLFVSIDKNTKKLVTKNYADRNQEYFEQEKVIMISDEVMIAFREYTAAMNKVVSSLNHFESESMVAVWQDNPRKALRLAACIAMMNHPECLEILSEDFEQAIYQVGFFSKQFVKFYKHRAPDVLERIYDFIKINQDMIEVSKTELRRHFFEPKTFAKEFDSLLPLLAEYCEVNNEQLKNISGGRKYSFYRIERNEDDSIDEIDIDFKVIGSKAKTSYNAQDTVYEAHTFSPLEKMEKFVKGTSYSTFIFDENKRLAANTKQLQMIGIDIDNDGEKQLSLIEAKKLFKDYIHVICTTRNHQKEKGEGEKKKDAKDRYRVLLLLKTPFTVSSTEIYKHIYLNVMKHFGLESTMDSSCNDAARLFFQSPDDCYYEFITKGKFLDINKFNTPLSEKKKYTSSTTYQSNVDNSGKVLTMANGDCRTFSEFEYLMVGDKAVPIFCPDHEDNNPSAFVKRANNDGQNLYYHCSACNKTTFIK